MNNNENISARPVTDEDLQQVTGGTGSLTGGLPEGVECPICHIGHALGGVYTYDAKGRAVLQLGCSNEKNGCPCGAFEILFDTGEWTGRAWDKSRKYIGLDPRKCL